MTTRMRFAIVLLIGASFTPLVSGCSVAFTYAGARMDAKNARRDIHTTQRPDSIPENYPVEVTLRSGQRITGQFKQVREASDPAYVFRYSAARDTLAGLAKLPKIREDVTATRITGRIVKGTFAGLGVNSVLIRDSRAWNTIEVRFADMKSLRATDGENYELDSIRDLMAAGKLPPKSAIKVGKLVLPLENIQDIHAGPTKTHYWLEGLVVGAILDVAIPLLITEAVRSSLSGMYGQ